MLFLKKNSFTLLVFCHVKCDLLVTSLLLPLKNQLHFQCSDIWVFAGKHKVNVNFFVYLDMSVNCKVASGVCQTRFFQMYDPNSERIFFFFFLGSINLVSNSCNFLEKVKWFFGLSKFSSDGRSSDAVHASHVNTDNMLIF